MVIKHLNKTEKEVIAKRPEKRSLMVGCMGQNQLALPTGASASMFFYLVFG